MLQLGVIIFYFIVFVQSTGFASFISLSLSFTLSRVLVKKSEKDRAFCIRCWFIFMILKFGIVAPAVPPLWVTVNTPTVMT